MSDERPHLTETTRQRRTAERARQGEALRANLQRRKAQVRARRMNPDGTAAADEEHGQDGG